MAAAETAAVNSAEMLILMVEKRRELVVVNRQRNIHIISKETASHILADIVTAVPAAVAGLEEK